VSETRMDGCRARAFALSMLLMIATYLGVERSHAADDIPEWRKPWYQEQAPFRIFGNTYYVGTRGLSAILITSDAGHVLIDGTLPDTASLVAKSIRALGFRVEDIELIVNSHTHSDHAGGIAELQRLSGASVAASAEAARAMERGRGERNDPQYELGDTIPPIDKVRVVRDRETLRVGKTEITVHYTPGHTPGGTSWTWTSCEGERCAKMVYADSVTAVSDDSFKFSGDARYPSILADFENTLRTIESLPCDILIAPHPEAVDLWSRLARREAGSKDGFMDRGACKAYAQAGRQRLHARVEREKAQQHQQP